VLEAADYRALRAEQKARRERGDVKQLGIGVSVYVEITSGPAPGSKEWGKVEINRDGSATIYSGSLSHGQSHATAFAMLVTEQTGIPMEKIDLVQGDTAFVPQGGGTNASKSLQAGGSAVYVSAAKVVDQARQLAADLLEASVEDVVLDKVGAFFHVQGTPAKTVSWAEVAHAAGDDGLSATTDDVLAGSSFPSGLIWWWSSSIRRPAPVEVARVVTCDDCGTILNPNLVEGQRHGGIAQGLAQALLEEVRYDADGNPITGNFTDYAIISAAELPSYELIALGDTDAQQPTRRQGHRRVGCDRLDARAAERVCDALSQFGVRHIDIPVTSEKVWAALSHRG
jgi:carbon-monoxide dehydrogenase large subunit